MEPWQSTQITKSLPNLLSLTVCNAQLLVELKAARMLADVDVQAIKAKRNQYDKATLLYDILQRRVNGFHGLIRALIATEQSGATKTLLQVSTTNIGSLLISLQDAVCQVSDLLSQEQIEAISSWINNNLPMNECLKLHENLQAAEILELVRDTIPKPYALYIPRLLSRRLSVNPDIFGTRCSDVFVFTEIEQPQLRKFVKLHTISSSSEQLLARKITSRFLLLDCDNDWNRICVNVEDPVHLIKYDKLTDTFLLENTTGGSTAIRSYLEHHGESSSQYVSEDAFLEIASRETSQGFCICDAPGMGKTLLLANIARKAREKWPERKVAFIQLQNLVLQQDLLNGVTMKTLELISTSSLASQIIYRLYKRNKVRLVLFFDGLDEVQHEKWDATTAFLNKICKDMPMTKVYVTSRPVVRVELEKAMGMIAYDIQPFNRKTQLSNLTRHWASAEPIADMNKLAEYAKYCIRGLRETLKAKRNITGVPLVCWLLAKVYAGKVATYADTPRTKPIKLPEKFVSSLYEIFNKFFARQLGETDCKFACMHKCDLAEPKSFHVWIALKLIVPNYSMKLDQCVSRFDKLLPCQILAPCVLDEGQQIKTYIFMHRTFAEYLVAEYFATNFLRELRELRTTSHKISPEIIYVGLHEIFVTDKKMNKECLRFNCYHANFRENVIVYFLDAMISQNYENITLGYASISPFNKTFFDWVEGCLHGNLPGLLNWLIRVANKHMSETPVWALRLYQELLSFRKSYNNPIANALHVAAVYSNIETFENLFQFFQKVFNSDLENALHSVNVLIKAMQLAIARGDYKRVHYLFESLNFQFNLYLKK